MRNNLWNIVLAAGAGRRLAAITGGVPKQFWSADGGRTLLEDTLERTSGIAPATQTLIVVDRTHAPHLEGLAEVSAEHRVIFQPRDRGTAAGVLLGLTAVAAADPDALILLTPSDHGVARPEAFVSGILEAATGVGMGRHDIVLFGVAPTHADGEYGWITPGTGAAAGDAGLRDVAGFVEKPDAALARRLHESGAVWNTMVMVARASSLLNLYRRHLPRLSDWFLATAKHPTADELSLLLNYDSVPVADFSRDLLGVAEGLVVHTWPASLGWSDLGTPYRLEQWRASHAADGRRHPDTPAALTAMARGNPSLRGGCATRKERLDTVSSHSVPRVLAIV